MNRKKYILISFYHIIYFLLLNSNFSYAQIERNFIVSDGTTIHYTIKGQGLPVFLLAGGPAHSAEYMLPIMNELSKSFQAILIYQRGTGKSKLQKIDNSNVSLEIFLNDFDELRKHLGYDKISILGHSFGGILTMSYAVKYPNSVKSLILVGSCGINLDFVKYFQANVKSRLLPMEMDKYNFWTDSLQIATNPKQSYYEFIRTTASAYFYDRKNSLKLIKDLTQDSFNYQISDILWYDLIINEYDLRAEFKEFKSPVLIIQGRQDIVGESTAYQIHNHINNSQLKFIEECGHFPWLEQEEQFFNSINEFLKSIN